MQLTPEQQTIIAHNKQSSEHGHAKVIAVAGAGKTTTLALFIQQQLAQGQNPKRLLTIMYNKSAQQDFSAKLARTIASQQALPQVRTFHALGLRIYQTLIKEGHLPAFEGEPLKSSEQEFQLWRLLQQFADKATAQDILQDKKKWLDPMMSYMEQVKSCLEPAKVVFKQSGLPAQCRFFVKVFDAFEAWRKQQKRITYSDMLYDPCMLFSQRSDLMMRFSNHMDWILVDEYQDINPVQQFLLQVLAGDRASVMVIGDPDQTIYEFRGSSAHFMLHEFDQQFPQAKQYTLSQSFRYGHDVALLANQLICLNTPREDVMSIAHVNNPDTQVHWHQSLDDIQHVIHVIQHNLNTMEPQQICILYRLWGMSAPLELALLEHNIPYQMPHHSWVLERFELQNLMVLFEMAADVFDQRNQYSRYQAWLLFFTQPALKIRKAELDDLAKKLAAADSDYNNVFTHMTFPDLSRWQKQQLEERMNLMRLAKDKRLKAHQLINRYIRETDFYKGLSESGFSSIQVEDKLATVQGFVRFINKLDIKASDAHAYFENLKAIKQAQKNQPGVVISSIHRAKGLEWPVVLMPNLNEHYYPYQSEGEMQQSTSIESERRLFYVAMTRAIHQLHLFSPSKDSQAKYDASPFLTQMGIHHLLSLKPAAINTGADTNTNSNTAAGLKTLQLPKHLLAMAQRYCQQLNWPLQLQALKPDVLMKAAKPKAEIKKKSSRYKAEPVEPKVPVEHKSFGQGSIEHETDRHWHVVFNDGQKRILDKKVAEPLMRWL